MKQYNKKAPVIYQQNIVRLIANPTISKLKFHQLDVNTVFLNKQTRSHHMSVIPNIYEFLEIFHLQTP